MAGKLINHVAATITGVNATGYVTVASTTGFYKGAKGAMTAGGQPSVSIVITEVASATSLGVRIVPDNHVSAGAHGTDYGRTNPTAYNTGSIIQHEQFLFNPNDLGLS